MIYNKKYKIFICATEQSGDNIGYNIITKILEKNPNVIFEGVGGSKMSPYLNNKFFSLENFKSIGIIEILYSLKKFIKMINFLQKVIINNNYNLIITIDSPDFNFPLVNKLRNNNFSNNIIHVVAPTVWAWRAYRAKKFSKVYDEIFVLFKFEIDYFSRHNIKTTFMGHPTYYIKSHQFTDSKDTNIAFLPGSREGELKVLLPYFKIAYDYLLKNNSELIIFIPTLPHLKKIISNYVSNWRMKVIVSTDIKEIQFNYLNSKYALVCSGTASLEVAKRNIPQLVIYKLNIFTEILVKLFINIKFANILNIIEDRLIIPEITNSNLNNYSFINSFEKLIKDEGSNKKQIAEVNETLKKIHSDTPPYDILNKNIFQYLD